MRATLFARLGFALLVLLGLGQLGRSLAGLHELSEMSARREAGRARYASDPLPQPAGGPLRVVFLGDSRARSWGAPVGVEGVEFLNRGVGGEPSAQTRERFALHVAPLRPDVVVVQTCVNQLKLSSMLPWRRAGFIDGCLEDLSSIIEQADEIGARVIATTVFPVYTPYFPRNLFFPPGLRDVIARANERIRALEAPNLVILDATPLLSVQDGRIRREYARDWLHLSPRGYAVLNEQLVPLLGAGTDDRGDRRSASPGRQ